MTRELRIAQLLVEIADRKKRCRESWNIKSVHPEHIFFAAHNYHRECTELHAAEASLHALTEGGLCLA